MEDNENKKSEGLGLIDVAAEDDSLLFSSFPNPTSYEFSEADEDEKCLNDGKDRTFLRETESCDEEILVSSVEEKEDVLQPRDSPEPQKVTKSGKYNLRKSLAWDNAFFTSQGVLEPEEISSMMESNHKSERNGLPTIQEDVNRSTESISTFQSDCPVENSQEFVLFEDVRASIQRSAKASDAPIPGKDNELGAIEVATSPTSSTVEVIASQEKMKPKASSKKLSIRANGSGKATKQPVSATRGLNTSVSKPTPNRVGKVRLLSTTPTFRASLDVSKTKLEKDSKLPAGKEPSVPRIPISRRPTFPKPSVVKSTLRSSAASKNELTSSCSSLESCASAASSSASHKSSLNQIKKKNDSSSRIANKSTSRGIMGQPRIPPPQPTKKTTKSNLSSAGSISDCSSESSRASATSQTAKSIQKAVSGANDTVKSLKNSKDASVVQADAKEGTKRVSAINGGLAPPGSMKQSGLRVPTPKIGFFDGGRQGSSSSAGKKVGKSPAQESSKLKTKAAASRLVPASSPKLQNKLYSKNNAEDQLEG
ncbi:PREDICTED: uncharacterized protein LOC106308192 [Brassica oleracea var. oleracea]|uniref:Uncharacterized protein n=1 Tax=Brassica oleracea var. oleracea TaxID=109376 RepID=A0A0D3DSR0_BRAOL|nr:PREDICTED: uncharacterized protein LOC106308192 [Brassica oleracea var. oleracea]